MNAVVLPIPERWSQIDPPRSKYRVADGVELDVSAIQGLPEDPSEWVRVELARRGVAAPPVPLRTTTTTGWPVLLAEGLAGSSKILVAMFQFLELGAVATLTGPAQAYEACADDVKLVLMAAKVHWGAPPVTLATLLEGFALPPSS